ncbi:MAG: hydantoinase B/oxoprolinase family protein [Rhodospirillaceae bacterium]|jgi:N-methylhydantoinase B|nr:hydantoinase B/oxoprolinase family protein [Rhodospirillaceae bacterium]MBT5898192.1 hydantoinase B/oxoprolinase family protein [Rhodospirillaceae bacterium]MBT6428505.1 hydantoinase B/oxoprolinase family protein [Rhodospirillaceae bacterium]
MVEGGAKIDPIRLGLIWQRLNGIVDQVSETFIRAAFSTVVRDNYDMAFSLLDTKGRQFVQSKRSIPSFIGTLPRTLTAVLEKFPIATLAPGDVIITNDAWIGTGHLNDISMICPIFRNGTLIAFAGSTAHSVDIGGAPSPSAQDCYEEGLCIPICKIMQQGEENALVIDFLEENLRGPAETLGDIRAQFAAYHDCERKIVQVLEEENLDNFEAVIEEIIRRSSASMRAVIADLPDGVYADEFQIDGFDEPLTIRCTVTIQGESIDVDFDGTSAQIKFPINSVMNYTYAYSCFALKCLLDPGAPNNSGSFEAVTIRAPVGCLLNAQRPAPVWGRHLSGHYAPPAIFGALSAVLPERVIAESGSPLWNVYFKGQMPNDGAPFVKMFFMNGGHGARPNGDGPGCLSFPSNVSNQPIELFENQAPLLVTEKCFVPDTAGEGRFRGGDGQRLSFKSVAEAPITMTIRHERIHYPPRGLLGGEHGAPGLDLVNGKPIPAKSRQDLQPGDVATFQTPGGGGLYPPDQREVAAVKEDLRRGLLSEEKARRVHDKF